MTRYGSEIGRTSAARRVSQELPALLPPADDIASAGEIDWLIEVFSQRRNVASVSFLAPIILGRRSTGEPPPYTKFRSNDQNRDKLIIADLSETGTSRSHALLVPLKNGRVHVANLSARVAIGTDTGGELAAGMARECSLPVQLVIGGAMLRITKAAELEFEPLAQATLPPARFNDEQLAAGSSLAGAVRPLSSLIGQTEDASTVERLVQWLRATMEVMQSVASSSDFLHRAAQTVANIVGLDAATVAIWDGENWQWEKVFGPNGVLSGEGWRPSQSILERVRAEKRTFRHRPPDAGGMAASLANVAALVAAPILDPNGNVTGAIYGDRRRAIEGQDSPEISILEAMLVELIASGVAAGLARVDQEQAALAARVQFEQFFTPTLARQLEENPGLLLGREMDISVLFVDIRRFSALSEKLGSARTVQWVSDAIEELSQCVLAHDGVLVDYVGDEIMAIWGAPAACADHATLACRAARDMLARLPELNRRWEPVLGEPMDIGIGVNSGPAHVGNIGSKQKFKYGALGNTVNLSSRVQGATKYFHIPALITGQTAAAIGSEFPLRRLCCVQVINIEQPVDLYELASNVSPETQQLHVEYESALAAVEEGRLRDAARILGMLVAQHPEDGPTLLLLERAVNALHRADIEMGKVWKLEGK